MKWLRFGNILVILFLWSPLLWVAGKGLNPEAFARLAARGEILSAASDSFLLALASASISTLLGTFTAFALPAMPSLRRKLVNGGLIFPILLPEIAIGLSFMVWFGKLHWSLGWGTLVASHVAFSFSYATLVMKTRVEVMDKSLLDAAHDLGASRWGVLRHAIIPQLIPGLAASMVTCFSLSLDDFLISFFVKGLDQVTLPIQIYSMMKVRVGPEIYALSLILFCISIFAVLLTQVWLTAKNRVSLSARS